MRIRFVYISLYTPDWVVFSWNRGEIRAFYCRNWTANQYRFFFNIEHAVKRFITMLKQKIAGVMIFHPLRLKLSADMSTCEIFYTTLSNNIVCFQIVWPHFNMPDS